MDVPLGTTGNETVPLSLKARRTHVYVIGKTGQGKSVLLENMMLDDLADGRGFAFLDPHGTSARRIADCIPAERMDDVVFFDPTYPHPIHFNPLQCHPEDRPLVAEQLIQTIHDIWPYSWGANLEYILLNAVRLLLENPGTTLLDLKKVLVNPTFRDQLLYNVKDDDLRSIWEEEFAGKKDKQWNEEIRSTLNKVGRFTSVPVLRNVIGHPSTIDISEIMDKGKVLIADLSIGKIGRRPANLIGALLVSAFAQAAERRTSKRPRDFTLYADEFQNFVTETFDTTLSESRKRRLSLILAHQYATQLPENLLDAVLGNVGTIIAFQAGAKSARLLSEELDKTTRQLTDLTKYHAWVKLPDHETRLMTTFPPKEGEGGTLQAVRANTRARHTRAIGPSGLIKNAAATNHSKW